MGKGSESRRIVRHGVSRRVAARRWVFPLAAHGDGDSRHPQRGADGAAGHEQHQHGSDEGRGRVEGRRQRAPWKPMKSAILPADLRKLDNSHGKRRGRGKGKAAVTGDERKCKGNRWNDSSQEEEEEGSCTEIEGEGEQESSDDEEEGEREAGLVLGEGGGVGVAAKRQKRADADAAAASRLHRAAKRAAR
eukprot:scaffold1452_cov117-Isochrysis_galbana.AAC.22